MQYKAQKRSKFRGFPGLRPWGGAPLGRGLQRPPDPQLIGSFALLSRFAPNKANLNNTFFQGLNPPLESLFSCFEELL